LIDLNVSTFPLLLSELRLIVAVWEPLDLVWCIPSGSDPFTTSLHLQLDHGTITRPHLPLEALLAFQDSIQRAIQRALATPTNAFYEGCLTHGTARATLSLTHRHWWQRRLLQHTPDLLAEATGSSVILYYKSVAIILSQASMKALHRDFITHVGTSSYDLVSAVDAIIAFRRANQRFLSRNPLTAAFMTTPQASLGVTSIPGKIAFRHYLDTTLADMLQGHLAPLVRNIIARTVGQPSLLLQPQDAETGRHMVDAIRSAPFWANWQSCCPSHSWFVQKRPPGQHFTPLSRLPTSMGFATDGESYFQAPDLSDLLEVVTRLRSGLMEGLAQHPLAPHRTQLPPE
jgi:hypothetical protein